MPNIIIIIIIIHASALGAFLLPGRDSELTLQLNQLDAALPCIRHQARPYHNRTRQSTLLLPRPILHAYIPTEH
jgi:hypothetical protein